jgi:hypothetical protein
MVVAIVLKKTRDHWLQWIKPVILATLEIEIKRIAI